MVFIEECGNFDCSKQKKKVFQDFEPMFSLKNDKNTKNPSIRYSKNLPFFLFFPKLSLIGSMNVQVYYTSVQVKLSALNIHFRVGLRPVRNF